MKSRPSCPLCFKTFSDKAHLSRHLKIHSGIKNFECPIVGCGRRFNRADGMKCHYESHKKRLLKEMDGFLMGTVERKPETSDEVTLYDNEDPYQEYNFNQATFVPTITVYDPFMEFFFS